MPRNPESGMRHEGDLSTWLGGPPSPASILTALPSRPVLYSVGPGESTALATQC